MEFPEVVTDGGSKVLIYTTNAGGEWPIHGAFNSGTDEYGWSVWAWRLEGRSFNREEHVLDISKAIASGEIKIS